MLPSKIYQYGLIFTYKPKLIISKMKITQKWTFSPFFITFRTTLTKGALKTSEKSELSDTITVECGIEVMLAEKCINPLFYEL